MHSMTSTLKSSIGKKSVMASSGLLLSLFLLTHLAGNATSFLGREAFNSYATRLHSLGLLIPVFEAGLLALFIVHVAFGLNLFFENLEARPCRYEIDASAGGRTLASRTMPYTGLLVLVFIVHHLARLHFTEAATISDLVRDNLSLPVTAGYYIFSLLVLTLHISHGFWSMTQTLGLSHPKYDLLLNRLALALGITIGVVFMLIPIMAFFRPDFLHPHGSSIQAPLEVGISFIEPDKLVNSALR
ncbi:MAG: succinate dehydrogenase cytochrome b subunit [Desulfobulbaceae bacterium]|nr:succinate dehydrogenase cytochrome b subunit [Desulfobulbaceae bacterium]